ncbi:hypothetical protein D3C79_837340 [compost metagenome]
MRQHRAGHAEGAGEGHVDHPQPLLIAHLGNAPGATKACVVDQHIDAAKGLFGGGDQGLHLGLDGDVAQLAIHGLQAGVGLELFNRLLQAPGMDIGNHQGAAAFFGAASGRGIADASAGGGGDEHGFTSQQLVAWHIGRGLFHAVYL